MKRMAMLLVLGAAFALPREAVSCGVCVEDRVAATYDHSLVRDAIARHRLIVFVALDGPDAARVGKRLVAAGAAQKPVQRGSVRYAASPAAFSFVLAEDVAPEAAIGGFRNAVAGTQVTMTIVRVMRDGALLEPAAVQGVRGSAQGDPIGKRG